MQTTVLSSLALFTAFWPRTADAYFETLTTADRLERGQIRAQVSPQFKVNDPTGLTLNSLVDLGYGENSDLRGTFGVGQFDFHFGGFYKYAPFPELERQPAIGFLFGSTYAHIDGANHFSFRIAPLLSKTLTSRIGQFQPYLSLPIARTLKSGKDLTPLQLVLGSAWNHPWKSYDKLSLMFELGLDLQDSFSYISLSLVFDLDGLVIAHKSR